MPGQAASAHRTGREASARLPAILALLALAGCRAAPKHASPVPLAASQAFTLARASIAGDEPPEPADRARAREEAERALSLAPDWVAPRRFLDELQRPDLLLPERLAEYQERLAQAEPDAATLYLFGRLMGARSPDYLEQATELDPGLAWAWHGLAVYSAREGNLDAALRYQRRSARTPRDPFEVGNFEQALARREQDAGFVGEALERLRARVDDATLPADVSLEIAADLAVLELGSSDESIEARGFERALALVQDPRSSESILARLADRLRLAPAWGLPDAAVELAFAMRGSEAATRLRTAFIRTDMSARTRVAMTGEETRADRALGFALGNVSETVEEWRAGLPLCVLDEQGMPREPRLAELVLAARETAGSATPEARRRIADALIVAGWFEEARELALGWWAEDAEQARALELRALAGLSVLDTCDTLVLAIDRKRAQAVEIERPPSSPGPQYLVEPVVDVSDMLRALVPALVRMHTVLGGSVEPAEVEREMLASPRIGYGPLASVVHPGPRFSKQDEELERGLADAPVPGLAQELARLGRFGVVGEVMFGGGPDAAILQTLWSEYQEGEHLGQRWSGTVVWCEGADVVSRFTRRGASIAGASVHEGYWIDVDVARANLRAWEELRERFSGPDGSERLERVARMRVPARLHEDAGDLDPLGEDERIALAVLRERGTPAEPLGRVTLDELLALLALHEEGHLCDRARFYPLGEHLFGILAFVAREAFDAASIARRLEYRAELVALCEAPDPRLVLAGMLRLSGNGDGMSATEHASAYRGLIDDLVGELQRALAADPAAFPGVEPDGELLYQLHRVDRDQLRRAAVEIARREGLVARAWGAAPMPQAVPSASSGR